MKALTVIPLQKSSAELSDVEEPPAADGPVLVETLAVGICGTDIEILSGEYGWAPPGRQRLVLGHESLGRVLAAPEGATVAALDLDAVGTVDAACRSGSAALGATARPDTLAELENTYAS